MSFEFTLMLVYQIFCFALRSLNGIRFFIFILLKQQAKVIITNPNLIGKALVFYLHKIKWQPSSFSAAQYLFLYFYYIQAYTTYMSRNHKTIDLKLLVVPRDDIGATELAVHTERTHLCLQGVP